MSNHTRFSSLDEQEARSLAGEVEKKIQSQSNPDAFGTCIAVVGYQGAGKTTATESIVAALGRKGKSVTSIEVDAEVEENVIVSERKKPLHTQHCNLCPAIAEDYDLATADIAVLDGVVVPEEIAHYAEFFNELIVLFIESHGLARHARLNKRDDDAHSRDDLIASDEKRRRNGLNVIEKADFYNTKIKNTETTEAEFQKYCGSVASSLFI